MSLLIEKPGPLSTLQDAGRFGVRHLGVAQGGPADLHAWAWANWLVGNGWGATALEITLGGLTLTAQQPCRLALCGADMQARVNGRPLPHWQSFTLEPGETLALGMARSGVRAYLAVAGGFQAEPVLDSTACVVRDGLGGHKGDGSPLAAGDELRFDRATQNAGSNRSLPERERRGYQDDPVLALIPGAQFRHFEDHSLIEALSRPWTVDPQSDRMGIRLKGSLLQCNMETLVSEGLTLGAVQVPPDGQPIVLLNDRQTIGGYPRLGTLSPLSCAQLAQCRPGQALRLLTTTASEAQREYRKFRAQF
ncbi:biotin-dependent carboxyltransferase family protein [Oceanimonas pelagia]|uniref:Biotin-dependent carboxyltransferase family protein n=1 Tax=Oceanimonas pelagia TaxID=3028314 RepID=A0AA50KMR7_9GAMM|nr:biotin-dependent carboxyltransferase family protein [Oceanimonas pelagia]WMC10424.1 biotin-dependent carboxyltransferase family protein [Oceanimonas pelagia]